MIQAEAVSGEQRHLDVRGAWKDDGSERGVACEPRMLAERDAAREEEAVAVGESHGGDEERMVDGRLSGGGNIGILSARRLEPEALALEGIGGEQEARS